MNGNSVVNTSKRRHLISGAALVFGSLAGASKVWGSDLQSTPKETAGSSESRARTALHQDVSFKTTPQRIYAALLSSKEFAEFSGAPAEIDPKAGGAFSMFEGMIVGRNVELIPNQRIVQAWRPTHWNSGVYSIVRFELKPQSAETLVMLNHTGFPEGEFDSLSSGWEAHYWDRLKKFLA